MVQRGFWNDTVIANTRQKLAELYYNNPAVVDSEKRVILEYWFIYDNLTGVLGDKSDNFTSWFYKATSPETITRCLRALKEDGIIKLNHEDKENREYQQQEWRQYWGNESGNRDNGSNGQERELL